jgi:hypothetical protein
MARQDLPRWSIRVARLLAALHLAVFVLSGVSGSLQAWAVLSAMDADIARDLLGAGGSPWDGFDGLVAGPLLLGVLEVPLVAALGPVGLVHVLAMGLVSTAGILLSHRLVDRVAGPRAALATAALLACPPPTLWYNTHLGAYHALALVLVPLGLLLLGPPEGEGHWHRTVAAGLCLGLGLSSQLGNVVLVAPALLLWTWARRGRRPVIGSSALLLVGLALGLAPMAWKAWGHVPWGGLAPPGGASASRVVKPLVLGNTNGSPWPERLWEMLTRDGPYGLHWELAGLPWLAGPSWALLWMGWAAACWAHRRRGLHGGWLLGGPPVAVAVGLVTGWFVFYPGNDEGFSRDGRHLITLLLAGSWCLGMAVTGPGPDPEGGGARWMRRALSVGVVLVVGGGALGMARSVSWERLPTADWRTPFRLEARYVSGYFRAPAFTSAPEAARRSCRVFAGSDERDCVRGVAFGFGASVARAVASGTREGAGALERCGALAGAGDEAAFRRDLANACAFGLGWGLSDAAWRQPARAADFCRKDPDWGKEGVSWCVRGVGWGLAQNFLDRPDALRRWVEAARPMDAPFLAEGVGIYAGMISTDPDWILRTCALRLPATRTNSCVAGSGWNERWMGGPPGP